MFQEKNKEVLFRSAFAVAMDYMMAGATYLPATNKAVHKSGKWLNSICLNKHTLLLRTVDSNRINLSIYVFKEEVVKPGSTPTWSAHFLKVLDSDKMTKLYAEMQTPDGYKRKWYGTPDVAIKALLGTLCSSEEDPLMIRTMPEYEFDMEARFMLD